MKDSVNDISNQTIVRILLIILAFVGGIFLVVTLRQQLLWIGISFFFALALEPPVNWISKRLPKQSRGLAVFLVVASTISAIAYLISIIGPPIIKQFTEMVVNLPSYYQNFINDNNFLSNYLRTVDVPKNLSVNGQSIANFFASTGGGVSRVFSNVFSSIFAFLSILVFTFFMVLEWPKWHEVFWRYQEPKKRRHRKKLYASMQKTVSGYIGGNLLTSLIAGVVAVIFFAIFKNPYAIALGFMVAIFDLIPMFGALIAAIIAVSVVLVYGGVSQAIITAVFFLVYQQIENNVLQPYVFSKTVNISPLLAGIAALFGAALAGLIGALVAIPIAASLQILVRDYLDRKYKNTSK
jgi:predicted PurR-regulated permease PerM